MEMLDPSADEIRDWGNSVIQFMTDYLGDLRARPVYRHTSSHEIRSGLDATLPIEGTDFDSLLKVFCDTIVPFSRQNAHPRMFGYVQSPGIPIAALADLLASTLNANLTIWRSDAGTGGTRTPDDRLDPANSWSQHRSWWALRQRWING